jgi:hypothetical protein
MHMLATTAVAGKKQSKRMRAEIEETPPKKEIPFACKCTGCSHNHGLYGSGQQTQVLCTDLPGTKPGLVLATHSREICQIEAEKNTGN